MVVIINGLPRAGKSQFVQYCKEVTKPYHVFEYSTVDFVKDLAKQSGWDGTKTAENRKFLSDLKDLLTQWNDVPFKKTGAFVQQAYNAAVESSIPPEEVLIFVHCREPQEIQKFVDYFGNDCITLLIRRAAVENNKQSNHADEQVFDFNYGLILTNDGTLEDLQAQARWFVSGLLGEETLK